MTTGLTGQTLIGPEHTLPSSRKVTHAHTHAYTCTYAHAYVHTRTHAHAYTHAHARGWLDRRVCVCMCVCACACACVCVCVRACVVGVLLGVCGGGSPEAVPHPALGVLSGGSGPEEAGQQGTCVLCVPCVCVPCVCCAGPEETGQQGTPPPDRRGGIAAFVGVYVCAVFRVPCAVCVCLCWTSHDSPLDRRWIRRDGLHGK
jgi:hypothetical protein